MHIVLEQFQGPLSLLLELIEKDKLDISKISLARIADQYVAYIENQKNIDSEELIGFLDIASRLLILKLRLILPYLSLEDEKESQEIENQLKLYQEYYLASKQIEKILQKNQTAYSNLKRFKNQKFIPSKSLNLLFIKGFFEEFLKKRTPMKFPEHTLRRVISLGERIKFLHNMLLKYNKLYFQKMISQNFSNRIDIILSFIALLELFKRQKIEFFQEKLFGEIEVCRLKRASCVI